MLSFEQAIAAQLLALVFIIVFAVILDKVFSWVSSYTYNQTLKNLYKKYGVNK